MKGLRTLCPLIALALAGCAYTPTEVRERGHRAELVVAGTVPEVATCASRAFDEHMPTVNVLRVDPDAQHADILARNTYDDSGPYYVVDFSQRGSDVLVEWFVRPDILSANLDSDRIRGFIADC